MKLLAFIVVLLLLGYAMSLNLAAQAESRQNDNTGGNNKTIILTIKLY